jgi:predicted dehydrogenase
MKKMKFLFAGCGSVGRRHIRNLKALIPCDILAYRVRNEDLGDFEREHEIQTFGDLDQALGERPDAVFVTNPTRFHLPVAFKAAERGCPLFIEKPLSNTLEGVDEFIELCEKKKIPVLLGYKMRFHKSIQLIKRLIDGGSVGKILTGRAHYGGYLPEWHPWEDYRRMYSSRQELGGGIVLDATHEIDYLYWLLGDVAEVKAFCGKLSPLEIATEDTAEILLRFQSGALGTVHMTYCQRPEFRACEVIGTDGTLFWDQHRKRVEVYRPEKKEWESYPEEEDYDLNQMFVEELKHFLACLRGEEKPIHNLYDSKRILEIALLAKQDGLPRETREVPFVSGKGLR